MLRFIVVMSIGIGVLFAIYFLTLPPEVSATSSPTPPAAVPQNSTAVSASSASPAQPVSIFATRFKDHLLIMGGDGFPHAFDNAKLAGVKYWAFYYSASWCPPCRAFTPELVNFYNQFKPSHPNFELIFVNEDNSDGDMIDYMKNDAMPWPAIWYQDIRNPQLSASKYAGPGIPCLVLVDANGNVLSDSFRNGQYVGAQTVMNDIPNLVQ